MQRTTRLQAMAFLGDVAVHPAVLWPGGRPRDKRRAHGQWRLGGWGSALGGVIEGEAAVQQMRHGGGGRGEKMV